MDTSDMDMDGDWASAQMAAMTAFPNGGTAPTADADDGGGYGCRQTAWTSPTTATAAFARAEDARDDAGAALVAAVAASNAAQAATTQEDADMYKDMAEAATAGGPCLTHDECHVVRRDRRQRSDDGGRRR